MFDSNTSRYSVVASAPRSKRNDYFTISELINYIGSIRTAHRLYAPNDSGFNGVGWIIDDDIFECMVCNKEFGFFTRKHHCRCCGNVVCYSCSPELVEIFEMQELGEQRVCVQCFWGQVGTHAIQFANLSD